MTEKCFCHLNGYKVKDADARAEIEKIAGVVDGHTSQLTVHDNSIKQAQNDITTVNARVTQTATELQTAIDSVHNNATQTASGLQTAIDNVNNHVNAVEGSIKKYYQYKFHGTAVVGDNENAFVISFISPIFNNSITTFEQFCNFINLYGYSEASSKQLCCNGFLGLCFVNILSIQYITLNNTIWVEGVTSASNKTSVYITAFSSLGMAVNEI